MLEQCCNYSKQCRNNVATLCCAKNRRCESSRVTSPYGNPDPESRKSEIEENLYSWALESGIQFKESGILLTIGIRNPSSTDKDCNLVPGIQNPRYAIQNPRLSWIPLKYLKSRPHGVHTSTDKLGKFWCWIGGRLGEVVAYESWSHREIRLYNPKCKTRLKGFSLAPEADRKQTQKVMGSHFYFASFQKEKKLGVNG